MKEISKEIQNLINDNLKQDKETRLPDRYIFHVCKDFRSDSLGNIICLVCDFLVEYHNAEIVLYDRKYIHSWNYQIDSLETYLFTDDYGYLKGDQKCVKLSIKMKKGHKIKHLMDMIEKNNIIDLKTRMTNNKIW